MSRFFFYLTADSPWKGRQREAELGCYWEIILSGLKPDSGYEVLCIMSLFYFIIKVNANIFKVMRNAFLRDFYFPLQSTEQQRTKKPDKNQKQ